MLRLVFFPRLNILSVKKDTLIIAAANRLLRFGKKHVEVSTLQALLQGWIGRLTTGVEDNLALVSGEFHLTEHLVRVVRHLQRFIQHLSHRRTETRKNCRHHVTAIAPLLEMMDIVLVNGVDAVQSDDTTGKLKILSLFYVVSYS